MQLNAAAFLIICPMLFLAGLVDSIGGGGGLISLPAYLLAGLPVHAAVATNKLSSTCGTSLTTVRFLRRGLVNLRLVLPSVAAAFLGSALGARLSLMMDEQVMKYLLFAVLPVAAFLVLNRHLFQDRGTAEPVPNRRILLVCVASAFVVGCYDGLYGPGTGTFLIIAFTVFAKMNVSSANAQAKVINLTSNVTSLCVFLLNGQVLFLPGLAGALCNIAGNYVGSGLAMNRGTRIVRPVILGVLLLLFLKILIGF